MVVMTKVKGDLNEDDKEAVAARRLLERRGVDSRWFTIVLEELEWRRVKIVGLQARWTVAMHGGLDGTA